MNLIRKSTIIGIFGASLFVSCVTSGRNFRSDLNWIQKGKTKQDDVRLVLGEPQAVGSSSGTPTWTYGFYKYQILGEARTKEIKFYWNSDHTVNSYSFTSSFPEDFAPASPGAPAARKPLPAPAKSEGSSQRPAGDVAR